MTTELEKRMDNVLKIDRIEKRVICRDLEVELMQSKKNESGSIVQAYKTSDSKTYSLDYMLIVKTVDYNIYFSYYAEIEDLFFIFDSLK